jgi:hypothetical protein
MHPSHLDGTMEGTGSANTMSGQHALLRLLFQRALDALLEHFLHDVLVTIVGHHVLVALHHVPSSYLDAIVCFKKRSMKVSYSTRRSFPPSTALSCLQ